jgi:Domain of unknown function (DUF1940).
MGEDVENKENPRFRFCDLTGEEISSESPYFKYNSSMRQAFASLGLAISTGTRLVQTRELLEMADKLYENITDNDVVLSDEHRKKLNHADDVWFDMKAKMNAGDIRAAHLLSASCHISDAHSYLTELSKEMSFKDLITDYNLKYLSKLSVYIYREAIGHVML